MDSDFFEGLLYQDESETLDFKADQYPFDRAIDEQKSELLKDILAFANAWRQTDAYILIGVEEVRGDRSLVCGVSSHLLNRNLQQFVDSKVNRPVNFAYSELEFEGKKVGVITIPIQDRPIYLTKDYGRLKAKVVYVRRGDTTAEAAPDDVAKMGAFSNRSESQPTLELSFADLEARRELGPEFTFKRKRYDIPGSIPDYGIARIDALDLRVTAQTENRSFLRDIAAYFYLHSLLQPVGFSITNRSTVAAINVKLRLHINISPGLLSSVDVRTHSTMPSQPSPDLMGRIVPMSLRSNGVEVSKHGSFYEVRFDIGTVQPGMTEWTAESIYIGATLPFRLEIEATLSADNLRIPEVRTLKISGNVEGAKMSLTQLREFANSIDSD